MDHFTMLFLSKYKVVTGDLVKILMTSADQLGFSLMTMQLILLKLDSGSSSALT